MAICVVASSFIPPIVDTFRGRLQIPVHLLLMIGISVNITAGLFSGLFSPIREEDRATTPRSGQMNSGLLTRTNPLIQTTLIELVLLVLCSLGCFMAFQQGRWWVLIVLINFAQGYGWVGIQSTLELLQSYSQRQIANVE
jgi:hypothetical protein